MRNSGSSIYSDQTWSLSRRLLIGTPLTASLSAKLPELLKRPQDYVIYPPHLGDGGRDRAQPQSPRGQLSGAQVRDSFLLKLLAVETAILITVGLLAVMGRDYFAWLLS
jgi:hypothetical protein